ncbi:hypothetical protein O181_083007 [Austropuccinia psidii MF-1]|uniref:Integrase catalytic domain-containing protein n=1 Tax=Austropuccinia psidii MF-1 TaxID=1389203 RepID=A0A9Q3FRK1_9BASI|nr:hypothetical protein [Austropuccinia psidii MF-1]
MATSSGTGIEIPIVDSSDEEVILKTKMIEPDTSNWVQWSCQMENYLTARRYNDLLIPPSEEVKRSPKFRQKNSSALALLCGCVSTELEGVLLDNKTSFYDTWEALGSICGKNCIVTICETFYKLISLKYNPDTSLQTHIHNFQKLCTRYNSITADKDLEATFPPNLLVATFIRSLNGDWELTGLIQTLYDIKPFTPAAVISRVSIEHSRRKPNEQALFVGSSNKHQKNKWEDQKPRNKGGRNGKRIDRPPVHSGKSDSDKRIENLERMIEKMQASMKPQSAHLATEKINDTISSDSDAFIVKEEAIYSVDDGNKIYLDSGAGKSVFNHLKYLSDPVIINHQINTYGNTVPITHQGTLICKGIKISPVYYAPSGPVNLLSVSQLLDHGIRPVIKNDCFLLKKEQTIVAAFKREGNLFVSKLEAHKTFFTSNNDRDWHVFLGHPSDRYLKHLTTTNQIKGNILLSKNCEVYQMAKIKNRPHSRALPSSTSAFHWLHVNTLEISPVTDQGVKYVLVIIDDYSRFNRIYLMSQKNQAQTHLMSYINKIYNKVNITPAFVHTDRGGEFDSNSFRQILFKKVIVLERGPPESPQTNGVAERFNQTLLSKIRCLLAQSRIPIQMWTEAPKHSSLLLNLLPLKAIDMNSPQQVLKKTKMNIEESIKLNSLIPFGMKTTVHVKNSKSKLDPRGETLKALTYESYCDGMRLYNQKTKKIWIGRDFQLPQIQGKVLILQNLDNLPTTVMEHENDEVPMTAHDVTSRSQTEETTVQVEGNQLLSNDKHYHTKQPDQYMLANVLPYSKAISDPQEGAQWKEAMKVEFDSLMSHNTGKLVPYPNDSKVIGGMWRLTKKLNEYGEVYRYKARWVVLGIIKNTYYTILIHGRQ